MAVLRPDEEASQSAIERDKNKRNLISSGLQTAAGLATGLGSAAATPAILSKIAPFLSEYIPADLALKGISKLSPKIGNFLKKGSDMGLDIREGYEFLKGNKQPQETESNQNPQDQRNVIQQYSPELNEFLESEIGKGRQPLEAGAIARSKGFEKVIDQIEKDHKTPWDSIIQSIFGGAQQAAPQKKQSAVQDLILGKQGAPQQDANAQLMAMMEKFSQSLKG